MSLAGLLAFAGCEKEEVAARHKEAAVNGGLSHQRSWRVVANTVIWLARKRTMLRTVGISSAIEHRRRAFAVW